MKIREISVDEINVEYFLSRINATDSCWNWIGSKTTSGYGDYCNGIRRYAHRISYCLFNGSISSDKVIDHKCMNKMCVNPDHLREVSGFINATENNCSVVFNNFNKENCKNGHTLSGDNLIITFRKKEGKEYRVCRECRDKISRENYIRNSEKRKNYAKERYYGNK